MSEQRSELIAGFDLGTTYFKVGLYDRMGIQRGLGRRLFEKDRPDAHRCEVPVEGFQRLLKEALDDAVAAAGCELSDIKGVSYAAQANTFLMLGRHDSNCRARTGGRPIATAFNEDGQDGQD